jgi:hypothetical protein
MVDRRRRSFLAVFLAFGIGAACSSNVDSRARLLDEECQKSTCATEGNAKEVTGITADSIGFRLGPGPGKVRIPLDTFTRAGSDSFSVELLLAGAGPYRARLIQRTCSEGGGSCTSETEVSNITGGATEEADWRPGGSFSGSSDTFSNFFIDVESDSTTERVDVIDVRYDTFDAVECSVSTPGR